MDENESESSGAVSTHRTNAPVVEERGRFPKEERAREKPKQSGRGWFFVIIVGLAIGLGILLIFGVKSQLDKSHERDATAKAVQEGAITVQVIKPAKTPPVFDFSLPGSAEALTTATLYARVNGYLTQRLVDIGDHVEEGQLLAEISAPDLDAQLRQSRAQLVQNRAASAIAQVTFEREKELLAQKVVAKQEYDTSEANFDQAAANVQAAESNVANLTAQQGFEKIVAPFTGVITERFLNTGALIAAGGGGPVSIYTEVQSDVLRVYIYVPQAYTANISVGQDVEVTAPQYPQKVFKGKVTRMADALDPTARTMRVEIQLPSEAGKLTPGMYLTIRFQVEQAEPALVVPAETLDIRAEGPRVAVLTAGSRVNYQPVKLGRDFGKTIEILSGLRGDETIVENPTTDLIQGEKVEVAKNPPNGSR